MCIANAIAGRDRRELAQLLASGTDFTRLAECAGEPALILAVNSDPRDPTGFAADAARLLIEHGADANESGTEWKTPLMHAAARGDLGLCALLLSSGADAGARDMFGRTAACWALLQGHERVAFVLRKAESRAHGALP